MSKKTIIISVLSLFVSWFIYKHQDINSIIRKTSGTIINIATGGKLLITEDGVVVAEKGEITNITSRLPDGFPKTLPIFPGSHLDLGVAEITEDSVSVNLTTITPIDDVYNFYKKWLPKRGWVVRELPQEKTHRGFLISNKVWQGNLWLGRNNHQTQIAIDLYQQ